MKSHEEMFRFLSEHGVGIYYSSAYGSVSAGWNWHAGGTNGKEETHEAAVRKAYSLTRKRQRRERSCKVVFFSSEEIEYLRSVLRSTWLDITDSKSRARRQRIVKALAAATGSEALSTAVQRIRPDGDYVDSAYEALLKRFTTQEAELVELAGALDDMEDE